MVTLSVGEYPPFDSADLPHQGLIPRIVSAAFLLEGVEVEYVFLPWPRAYEESKSGNVHGTVQWLHSEQRAKEHYYSDPIMEESYVWFHMKKNAFDWHSFDDLKGMTIGARQGFTYIAEFYEAIDSEVISVSMLSNNKQNVDMLFHDRIDAFIEQIDIGYYGISRHYYGRGAELFTHHPKPIFSKQNHLLLSREHKDSLYYLAKFNAGLKRLRASGVLQQFIDESRQLESGKDFKKGEQ
jgi:polar amino acid transport system substrate-binding protein